jgi:hypothetical protein
MNGKLNVKTDVLPVAEGVNFMEFQDMLPENFCEIFPGKESVKVFPSVPEKFHKGKASKDKAAIISLPVDEKEIFIKVDPKEIEIKPINKIKLISSVFFMNLSPLILKSNLLN